MGLTLSDMDSFSLDRLDNLTIKELDNMTFDELIMAVRLKNQIIETTCDKEKLLSDEQAGIVTEIVYIYNKEQRTSLAEKITIQVAVTLISTFLIWCAQNTSVHLPEIMDALKQAYLLLEQLINQIN